MESKEVPQHMARVGQRLIDGLNQICQSHDMGSVVAYGDPVPAMPRLTWKAGQALSDQEMEELIRQLEACAAPRTCPHGRPTMIHMSAVHLAHEFGRLG